MNKISYPPTPFQRKEEIRSGKLPSLGEGLGMGIKINKNETKNIIRIGNY